MHLLLIIANALIIVIFYLIAMSLDNVDNFPNLLYFVVVVVLDEIVFLLPLTVEASLALFFGALFWPRLTVCRQK